MNKCFISAGLSCKIYCPFLGNCYFDVIEGFSSFSDFKKNIKVSNFNNRSGDNYMYNKIKTEKTH